MRFITQGHFKTSNGMVVPSGTVSVFYAGTTTPANIYTASSGGTAVNSVTSAADGSYIFYVDDKNYSLNQKFKIVLSKENYVTKTYDDVVIFPPVPSNNYYVDYNATDQGATTNAYSVKSIINAVGSNNATIIFRNSSGSATTNYVINQALTIPSTIELKFEIGARFSQGGSGSITGVNIVGNPMHQIFSGFAAGEVVFGYGSVREVRFNYDLTVLMAACSAGSIVELGNYASYSVVNNLTISVPCLLRGQGAAITFTGTGSIYSGILITASDVNISGIKIEGSGHANYHVNRIGIKVKGTNDSTRLSNIKIENCFVDNWPLGINLEYVDNFSVVNNKVTNLYDSGISITTGAYGLIDNNYVDTVTGAGTIGVSNAYGIIASISATLDTPVQDITISNNTIKNVTTWHGINTHGGKNIHVIDNNVSECFAGVQVVGVDAGGNSYSAIAPIVRGNVVTNTSIDKTAYTTIGINVVGYSNSLKLLQGIVDDNIVSGFRYGVASGSSDSIGIYENNIKDCLYGIGFTDNVSNMDVHNNLIDSGTQDAGNAHQGIGFYAGTYTGYCADNNIKMQANASDIGIGSLGAGATINVDFGVNKIVTSAPLRNYYNNGTLNFGSIVVFPGSDTVSSATVLNINQKSDIFFISGTTSITSINTMSTMAGRKVTLVFADVLTFTDGGNLALAGNFVTTGNDTISLVSDGSNWFEVARSVN